MTILLAITGCKDSRDQMAKFVKDYNDGATYRNIQSVSRTSAEADYKNKIIKIKTVTTFSISDPENNFIKQIMPNMMMETLKNQPLSRQMLDKGVKFEIIYYTDNLSEISSIIVDKKKMDELNSATADVLNNQPSIINPKPHAPTSELGAMLAALNKSLPYTDPSSGMTIFRVDQNRIGDLVYHVRAPKDLVNPLKTEAGISLVKSEILRSGKLSKMLNSFVRFNITAVKYIYYDQKGNQLNELRLTTADFR
ncbi:hypothetical protein [Pedobacter sp. AK013]|uniref:hypothetical protein n=1 Tax=Pedobacter sp. AK013 TaxID=2723071 RepID=UPI00161706E8|nr:hypothetical protein [Pedobacter sp. AK013]